MAWLVLVCMVAGPGLAGCEKRIHEARHAAVASVQATRGDYTRPMATMALATLLNPAMLAPAT